MIQRLLTVIFLSGFCMSPMHGQTGGTSVYRLLNLAGNARFAALGGSSYAAFGNDPSAGFQNPASIHPGTASKLSMNAASHLAGIRYGYLAYGHDWGKWGTWAAGIQYLDYGDFIEANEFGEITGSFSAAEYTFTLSGSWAIDSLFRIGVNLRPVYSVLERYQSFGVSSDAALLYQSRNLRTTASVGMRNLGKQLTTYYSPEPEPLPFEVMAGLSHKLQYAPFRIHASLRNLQQFYLRAPGEYEPQDRIFNSALWADARKEIVAALDHLSAGVEFIPGNLISLRFSYNFLRRYELRPDRINSASGFSFGAGLNMNWIRIDYALVNYHFSARTHMMTACIDLNHFRKN